MRYLFAVLVAVVLPSLSGAHIVAQSSVKPGRYRIAIEGKAYDGTFLAQDYRLSGTFVVGDIDVNSERIITGVDLTIEMLPNPEWGLSGAVIRLPQAGCGQRFEHFVKDASDRPKIFFELETCFKGVKTGTIVDHSGSDSPRFILEPFCASGLNECRMGTLSGLYVRDRISVSLNATGRTYPILIEPAP